MNINIKHKSDVWILIIIIGISFSVPILVWAVDYRWPNNSPEYQLLRDIYGILNRPINEKKTGTAPDTEYNLLIKCIERHECGNEIDMDRVVKMIISNPGELRMSDEWVVSAVSALCAYRKDRNVNSSELWSEAILNNIGLIQSRRPELLNGSHSLLNIHGLKRMLKFRDDGNDAIRKMHNKSG